MSEHVLDQNKQGSGFSAPNPIYALWGDSESGNGVVGTSYALEGVYGEGFRGVTGISRDGNIGVLGQGKIGVVGQGETGVSGYGADRFGIVGVSDTDTGTGVYGQSSTGVGVSGQSDIEADFGVGVLGKASNAGVVAFNHKNNNAAYLASECCAAWFTGGVHVAGDLSADVKHCKIDHPQFPDTKYLIHASVESSEMKNIYDGVSVLDSNGETEVVLPAWFEAFNTDFRYQLTAIGGAAPNIHIAAEITNRRFKISGGVSGMRISWQVTGVRRDAWVAAHPLCVEQEKSAEERGYYHP